MIAASTGGDHLRGTGIANANFLQQCATFASMNKPIFQKAKPMDRVPPQFEFLMNLAVDVGEIVSMGAAPLGERRVVAITGGTFEGEGMRGEVLPGGNDWQIGRADGVLDIDASYVLKDQAGGLVRVVSQGFRHGPAEVLAALGRGEDVPPNAYVFRAIMRFETGAPHLAHLNRTIAVATGHRKARQVLLSAYKLL